MKFFQEPRRTQAAVMILEKSLVSFSVFSFIMFSQVPFRYQGRPPQLRRELRKRLLALSAKHPRYGYRRIAALLRREGWRVVNATFNAAARRRAAGATDEAEADSTWVSTGLPTTATHRNHVWTWDFIADATVRGGTLKLLTILDEYTRECHVLWRSGMKARMCCTGCKRLWPSTGCGIFAQR